MADGDDTQSRLGMRSPAGTLPADALFTVT
jgi:hypothetical protein